MKRIYKIIAGAAGAASLVVVTAVAAAPYGPMGGAGPYCGAGAGWGPGMGPQGYGMGMMQGGRWGAGPQAMSAEYLTQMKAQLAITAAQEPAWQAFAAKAAEQAALMQATRAQHWQAGNANAAAPERMARQIDAMSQHLAGMQAVNTALKDLYALLTPEQRSLADQTFGAMGGRGWGPGYGRGTRG